MLLKSKLLTVALIAMTSFACAQTASLPAQFDQLLNPYFNSHEPGGVVLVAKGGQVIYQKAFGLADMELNVPVNDSMIFYIGSNTKQFTAVAILQLLEQGKIQLQDTIGKFIPCPWPASGVTIQQVLSHTSGLGSNYDPAFATIGDKPGNKTRKIAEYILRLPMIFSAGTKWEYNNAGFYVLGYLIEKLSGESYADYVTAHLFKPAGMYNTYMEKEMLIVKNRPNGYTNFKVGMRNIQRNNMGATAYAAGGIQSTVADMLKWNRALLAGTIIQPATLTLAFTPQRLLNGQPVTYGFGWHLETLHGSPTIRHGGLVPGYTSETLYLPKEDVYVVILLNEETAYVPITALSRIIGAMAIGKPYIFNETAIDKQALKKFTGLYENKFNELVNISEQNGRLIFQRPNGGPNILYYAGNNEFFFEKDYFRVQFMTDSVGKIKSLQTSKVDIGMTEWFKTPRPLLKLAPGRVADSLLQQYAGKYSLPNEDTLTITRDGLYMYYQNGGEKKQLLAAGSDSMFFSLTDDVRITFVKETGALVLARGNRSKQYYKASR